MNQQETVVLVPFGNYAFEQQLSVAKYLGSNGGFKPHFFLVHSENHAFASRLDEEGISFDLIPAALAPDRASNGLDQTRSASAITAGPVKRAWDMIRRLRSSQSLTQRLAKPLAPRCAIVSQDRVPEFIPVLKALKNLKIPVILVPAGDSSPDGSAWLRRDSYPVKAGLNKGLNPPKDMRLSRFRYILLNRTVSILWPAQVYRSPWGNMLFMSAAAIFLYKLLGILPRSLWYQGTTYADYILVSGDDEMAIYAEGNVESSKLLYFGNPELDSLHCHWANRPQLRMRLADNYELSRERPMLIVSLPPLWEHDMAEEQDHWESIKGIMDALAECETGILVSLHPRCRHSDYSWLEDTYQVKISREPLIQILAAADVFVCTFSSTLRWAVALGIPTVNLDVWQFDFDMYRSLTGYQTANTYPRLTSIVRELASQVNSDGFPGGGDGDNTGRPVLADGKANERLLSFIQAL